MKYSDVAIIEVKGGNTYLGMHNNDCYNPQRKTVTLWGVNEIRSSAFNRAFGEELIHLANESSLATALEKSHLALNAVIASAGSTKVRFRFSGSIEIPVAEIKGFRPITECHRLHSSSYSRELERIDLSV